MSVDEGLLPVGTTGDYLDTTKVTQTDGTTAHREAVYIADPETTAARISLVGTDENPGSYALPVSDDKMDNLISTMGLILEQLKIMNLHFYTMTDEVFDPQDTE